MQPWEYIGINYLPSTGAQNQLGEDGTCFQGRNGKTCIRTERERGTGKDDEAKTLH